MPGPRKTFDDLDRITKDNEQFQTKLVFFKVLKDDVRWHIALPEMTTIQGFISFCGMNCWSATDTSDRQRLEITMKRERSEFCERCAEELIIAFDVLKARGYLHNKQTNI